MLFWLKAKARNLGLNRYLDKPYDKYVKSPYWFLRRRIRPKLKKTIAGVDVEFVAEQPHDILYQEYHTELPIIEDIVSELTNDDVFYDIGANIGLYSCVLSRHLTPEDVVAFEPSPPAYKKLKKNARINGDFSHHQVAVSHANASVDFAVDVRDTQSRLSTLNVDSTATDYELCEVQSRKLSTVTQVEGLPLPTAVKIDVEGAEYNVLKGMGDLLDGTRVIYCEIHHPLLGDFGTTGSEIREFLRSSGFTIEDLHQREENDFIKATRESDTERSAAQS